MIKLVLLKREQVDLWAVGMSEEAFIPARQIKQQKGAKNLRQN
jgi:hypothetical protein